MEEWSRFFPEQLHHINVQVLHPKPKKRLNSISSKTNSLQNQKTQEIIDNWSRSVSWPLGWLVVVRLAEENYVSSTAGGLISLVNDLMFWSMFALMFSLSRDSMLFVSLFHVQNGWKLHEIGTCIVITWLAFYSVFPRLAVNPKPMVTHWQTMENRHCKSKQL